MVVDGPLCLAIAVAIVVVDVWVWRSRRRFLRESRAWWTAYEREAVRRHQEFMAAFDERN